MQNIIIIFGDQLSFDISSLSNCDKNNDIILMCEVAHEATFVKHHKKKIAFLFSAMRHFTLELESKGYVVEYIKLNDPSNTHSFEGEVKRALAKFN
jgi:deoxyribodipyrimidine photolyase-related protein